MPFFRKGLNYSEAEWITCGCICTVRKEEWKDYCDFVDIAYQKRVSRSVTRWLSLYHSLPKILQLYAASNSYFMSIDKPTVVQKRFFWKFFEQFLFNTLRHCNHLWLLLLSKFRILRSQKHYLLRLYRVLPLWKQGFKRDNQMYISSQVKSAQRKFSEGKVHDCDSFMTDVSVLYKSCDSHLAKSTTLLAEFKCFD